MHFKKANMRTKRNVSPRLSSASVITLLRSYRQSKERRTRLCKKSDRKQGRNAQHLPSFLFLSVFFRKQRHPSTGFSRRRHQELSETEQTSSQTKLHPTAPTQRHTTAQPADADYAHSRPPNLRALPPPSQFRSHTRKQLPIFRWIAV